MIKLKKSLESFPKYIQEAVSLGKRLEIGDIQNIVVSGMGGSAISGDILKDYLRDKCEIPVIVDRNYKSPFFVDESSLVFIISYSGKTEEDLYTYRDMKNKRCREILITSNEKLELEVEEKIKIPPDLLSRASLPYLFFPILNTLEKSGSIKEQSENIKETIEILEKFKPKKARNLAEKIKGKIPIIYTSDNFSSMAYRWQTQLNENSKILAHHHVFTELNHNEIEGNFNPDFFVIVLKDEEGYKRVNKQIELSEEIISEKTNLEEIKLKGNNSLAKIFYGIYFGDWVSYFLAKLRGDIPEETKNIDRVKKGLKRE